MIDYKIIKGDTLLIKLECIAHGSWLRVPLHVCLRTLSRPNLLFILFNYSSKIHEGPIYFIQILDATHLLAKVLSPQKGKKDSFYKVGSRTNKEISCYMTKMGKLAFPIKWFTIKMGKLAFPIKWFTIEKQSYKRALIDHQEKDCTTVDIITNIS